MTPSPHNGEKTVEDETFPKAYRFNAERREMYLALLAVGVRRTAAARKAGVNPLTAYRHIHGNPRFAEQVAMAEHEANEAMERALYKNGIEKNNVIAQLAWLNNRMPDRWVDRRSVVMITDQALEAEAVSLRRRLAELEAKTPYEQLPSGEAE